jgi:hypothetical protein
MFGVRLSVFGLVWMGIIYLFDCWLAGEFNRPKLRTSLLYVTTMAALGLLGEIVFDTVYNLVFHRALWLYLCI